MGSKVFAVIDTNVIVSALISKNPESSPLLVLPMFIPGPSLLFSMLKSSKSIGRF
jgi:hypothetical protein